MPQESVDSPYTNCPYCGIRIWNKDKSFVTDHNVWHVICYECGKEFIE